MGEQRNTVEPWLFNFEELELCEIIGTGFTAEVYRARWQGTEVAVKRLRSPWPTEFHRELSVLQEFRHPNLVLFMGACTSGEPAIVSELCEGGSVFQLLHQCLGVALSWSQRLKVALDTAKGANFLHCRRVVHRDLKSLNLLLFAKVTGPEDVPQTKISDFGLSRPLPAPSCGSTVGGPCVMTGGVGTCHWMAPEVLSGMSYNEKADVYSYGVVLYEIACRHIPFEGSGLEPVSVAVAVSRGERPSLRHLPFDCPEELRYAMQRCWGQVPMARPGLLAVIDELGVAAKRCASSNS